MTYTSDNSLVFQYLCEHNTYNILLLLYYIYRILFRPRRAAVRKLRFLRVCNIRIGYSGGVRDAVLYMFIILHYIVYICIYIGTNIVKSLRALLKTRRSSLVRSLVYIYIYNVIYKFRQGLLHHRTYVYLYVYIYTIRTYYYTYMHTRARKRRPTLSSLTPVFGLPHHTHTHMHALCARTLSRR